MFYLRQRRHCIFSLERTPDLWIVSPVLFPITIVHQLANTSRILYILFYRSIDRKTEIPDTPESQLHWDEVLGSNHSNPQESTPTPRCSPNVIEPLLKIWHNSPEVLGSLHIWVTIQQLCKYCNYTMYQVKFLLTSLLRWWVQIKEATRFFKTLSWK